MPERRRPASELALANPPADPGLPAIAAGDVVASQSALIVRLRRMVGGDDAAFAARHLAPIEALAREIHLLPASADAHFAGAGGLFRQCLECAFFGAQAAAGRVFVGAGPAERRHALEPRWRHAAFLAGLACEMGQPLADVVVRDAEGRAWPRHVVGLDAWIDERGIDRYHVDWLPASQRAMPAETAVVLARIVPPASLAWLAEGAPEIARAFFSTALGQPEAADSPLGQLIAGVRRDVLHAEAARRPARHGLLRVDRHEAARELAPAADAAAASLTPDEVQCVRTWQGALAAGRVRDIVLLSDGRVALSHELARASHPDAAALLRAFDRRGWLGHGGWPARRARVGLLDFDGVRKPGFVLTASAAQLLGLGE